MRKTSTKADTQTIIKNHDPIQKPTQTQIHPQTQTHPQTHPQSRTQNSNTQTNNNTRDVGWPMTLNGFETLGRQEKQENKKRK